MVNTALWSIFKLWAISRLEALPTLSKLLRYFIDFSFGLIVAKSSYRKSHISFAAWVVFSLPYIESCRKFLRWIFTIVSSYHLRTVWATEIIFTSRSLELRELSATILQCFPTLHIRQVLKAKALSQNMHIPNFQLSTGFKRFQFRRDFCPCCSVDWSLLFSIAKEWMHPGT